MPTTNEIIQNLLNTVPSQSPTVENTFNIEDNPSLNRIANNGKMLTQNVSKLTQTLKNIIEGWSS